MFTQRKSWLSGMVAGLLMAASVSASAEQKTLHVYNGIALASNSIFYANGNKAATPLVDAEVRNNPGIYPPADVR